MLSYSFILLLIVINTLCDKSAQPLRWSRYQSPTFHKIFSNHQTSLSLFLTNGPVVRIKSSESKLRLFQNTQIIDISKLSLSAHNLKRSIDLLRSGELTFESNFHSVPNGRFEFLLKQGIGFHQCENVCAFQNSHMMFDFAQLKPVISLFGKSDNLDISKLWVSTNQSQTKSTSYGVNYEIYMSKDNQSSSLFPRNMITKEGSVDCLAFYANSDVATQCHHDGDIGGKTSYWQKSLKQSLYYTQQFYKLNVQLVLDDSFSFHVHANLTNVTSEFEWQKKNANFRILIPVSRDIQLNSLQRASCICVRSKSYTDTQEFKARSALAELALRNKDLYLGMERQRVKHESSSDLSSVSVLLSDQINIKSRKPVGYFLNSSLIYPLSVNSSDSAILFRTKLSRPFDEMLDSVGFNQRQKKAATPLILGTLKILSLGMPYLLDESIQIIGQLIKNVQAEVITPNFQKSNQISSQAFAELLQSHFTEEIKFNVFSDRIKVDFQKNQSDLIFQANSILNEKILADFSESSQKLIYFQEKLLQILPQLLLRRLLPQIQDKMRPDGKIFHHVTLSKSFLVLDYYWEQLLPNSKVTNYRFWPLPSSKNKNIYQSFDVQNLTISLASKLDLSSKSNQVLSCQQRFLTSVPLEIGGFCPLKETTVSQASLGLKWINSSVILIRGPSTLHFTCQQGTNQVIHLKRHFNLFLIHDVCTLHVVFKNGLSFNKQMISQKPINNFGLLHLLAYDLTEVTSFSAQTHLWLVSLTTIVAVVIIAFVSLILYLCYFKSKIGIRIWNHLVGTDSYQQGQSVQFTARKSESPGVDSYLSADRRPSSVSTVNQLPQGGGPKAEKALNKAFQDLSQGPQCDHCAPMNGLPPPRVNFDGELPNLKLLPGTQHSVEYVFPNMYHQQQQIPRAVFDKDDITKAQPKLSSFLKL